MCFKRHHRTSSTISARSHHSISSCAEEDEEVSLLRLKSNFSMLVRTCDQRLLLIKTKETSSMRRELIQTILLVGD